MNFTVVPLLFVPLLFVPWIYNINPTLREALDVTSCHFRPPRFRNGGNLRVRLADGPATDTPTRYNLGKSSRRCAVKTIDSAREVFRKHGFGRNCQMFAAFAFG